MLKDFKTFILRGNVVELAVAEQARSRHGYATVHRVSERHRARGTPLRVLYGGADAAGDDRMTPALATP